VRIACVLIQNLAVQLLLAERSDLRGRPVVIGGLPFETKPVSDASPEALAYGVRPGISIREAQALCPEAACFAPDEARYQQTFKAVADILEDFSPVIEVEKLGCAYIDITGVQREGHLASEVILVISSRIGLSSRAGIASGKFFSKVAAMTSKPDSVTVVLTGEEERFVTPFSMDFTDCSDEVKERLMFLGVRFIGQLRDFPKEALSSQFGVDGVRLYQLSHGIDHLPLIPRRKIEIVSATSMFEAPASTTNEIYGAMQPMLGKLLGEIREQGKICHEVLVGLKLNSGSMVAKRLSLKEGSRSEGEMLARIRASLAGMALANPVTGVELSLSLTAESGRKLHLWQERGTPQAYLKT
jgi:DNA polymerase IV